MSADRPKPDPAWCAPFLLALAQVPVVRYACEAAGIERTTVWRYRQSNPAFEAAYKDAIDSGDDKAEREAFRRGVEGYEEPVLHQGQMTPVWMRDTKGNVVTDEYDTGRKHDDGSPVIGRRPVQARDADGNLQWLTVRKHSDQLLTLILKGRRKAIYAERTEITGADGGPVAHSDETTRAARLAHLIDVARLRKEAEDLG